MNGVALVVVDNSGRALPGVLGYILDPSDRSVKVAYAPTNVDGFVATTPLPAGPFSGILVLAGAAKYYEQPFSYGNVDGQAFSFRVGASAVNPSDIPLPACSPFKSALPTVPTRDALLKGQCTMQGLMIHTEQWGWMPWWPACWAWLTKSDRAYVATQLLQLKEEIIGFQYPDGRPLYDEGGQFYSPDKFPALLWTMEQTADLVAETIGYGFKGCWIFLGGDDGNNGGFFESQAQVRALGPVLVQRQLAAYCVVLPGWDGVWHKPNPGTGYSPAQIRQFSMNARAAGFRYVGIEGGTGYLLCGEGGGDYQPGGAMSAYDLILSEYDDGAFTTGDFWQIMARYLGPAYVMPPDQRQIIANGPSDPLYPQANDHPASEVYVLGPLNEQGQPYVHRPFEYGIYGAVRGTPPSTIQSWRQHFIDAGATNPC